METQLKELIEKEVALRLTPETGVRSYRLKKPHRVPKGFHARLGMACKLVYNNWRYEVASLNDPGMVQIFIQDVIDLYKVVDRTHKELVTQIENGLLAEADEIKPVVV